MKLLIHMNMPSGKNDGTHQLILDIPHLESLHDLSHELGSKGLLYGIHMLYDRSNSGARVWRSRGLMVVNVAHIGKIAEYYEGENEAS